MTRRHPNVWKQEVLQEIIAELPRDSFQRDPYFPDLLRQPDLLAVPESGRLFAIFVYGVQEPISWRSALACLEDLLEIKLSAGSFTLVIGVAKLLRADDDKVRLLRNMFDLFYLGDGSDTGSFRESLMSVISQPAHNSELTQFLEYERELVHRALGQFSEDRYRELIAVEQEPQFEQPRNKAAVAQSLSEAIGLPIIRNILIRNVKGEIADLRMQYSFEFDYGIEGRSDVAIEVLRSGRYGSRDKIRYLMVKARLLRYEISDGRLHPNNQRARLILIVNGNIAGPEYDPFRYVRSLTSVGWELVSADRIYDIRRLLGNENV